MRRTLFALIVGIGGVAVLLSLGLWQMRRLEWKQAILDHIAATIAEAPVPLESLPAPDPARDQYRPVTVTGTIGTDFLQVLAGDKLRGNGVRIISALDTGGRKVLLDRGFVADGEGGPPAREGPVSITGNLLWPQDADAYTPPPDLGRNLWFSRDVAAMAKALGTEPLLVVRREGLDDAPVTPVPVDTSAIPNDHLNYAITWFSLAAVWAGMTAIFLWRIRRHAN